MSSRGVEVRAGTPLREEEPGAREWPELPSPRRREPASLLLAGGRHPGKLLREGGHRRARSQQTGPPPQRSVSGAADQAGIDLCWRGLTTGLPSSILTQDTASNFMMGNQPALPHVFPGLIQGRYIFTRHGLIVWRRVP